MSRKKKSSKVIKFLNSARFDIELEIIYYWCIYCMHGETLVIILPFAFFCWDDIISVRCVVVWVAIWIKPIERILFHAFGKPIELGKKKNFYGVRNTFKSNLPAWIIPRRGISIEHMHGRVELLTFCSSTYFECQFYLWKHSSIISNANKI